MADRHVKSSSKSLIFGEMKIKTTVRYHLTPVRMTTIKKYINIMLARMWRKGKPLYTIGGNVNWCSHYGKQDGGSPKTKNTTTI